MDQVERRIGYEASSYVWDHLWKADDPVRTEFHILDVLQIGSNGVLTKWMFTTKEGCVKVKGLKKRNTQAVMKALKCCHDRCPVGFHGYFCTEKSNTWTKIPNQDGLRELVDSSGQALVIIPHPHPEQPNAKFLQVECIRPTDTLQEPKFKYHFLSYSRATGKVKEKSPTHHEHSHSHHGDEHLSLPSELLPCRNQLLKETAKEYILQILNILETRGKCRIVNLTLILHMGEVLTFQPGEVTAINAFKVTLHHATQVSFLPHHHHHRDGGSSSIGGIGELSTKMTSHGFLNRSMSLSSLGPSATSTYIKPWTFCAGVFCHYTAMDSEAQSGFGLDIDLDDENAVSEGQRAIARHKATTPGGDLRADSGEAASSVVDDVMGITFNPSPKHHHASDHDGSSGAGGATTVPIKTREILYKQLASVREEIKQLEAIDREFIDEAHDASEKLDSLYGMREAAKAIWPLPVVRWWFNRGQFEVRVSAIGNDISHDLAKLKDLPMNDFNQIKWFALHHSLVHVCECCYKVYCKLETYRKGRHEKARKELIRTQHQQEEELSLEEQRKKDREIEQRIFRQRQFMSKLSKSPHHKTNNGSYYSESLGSMKRSKKSLGAPSNALPPLPWRLSNDEEREQYLQPTQGSLANHLLQRPVLKPLSSHGHQTENDEQQQKSQQDQVVEEWQIMLQQHQERNNKLPALSLRPPTIVGTQNQQLKIAVDQYTAENLLHPWQRDLQRLKNVLNSVGPPQAPAVPSSSGSGIAMTSGNESPGTGNDSGKLPKAVSFKLQPDKLVKNIMHKQKRNEKEEAKKLKSRAMEDENEDEADEDIGGMSDADMIAAVHNNGSISRNSLSTAATSSRPMTNHSASSSAVDLRPGTSAQNSRGSSAYGIMFSGHSSRDDLFSPGLLHKQTSWSAIPGMAVPQEVEEENEDDDEDEDVTGAGHIGWSPFTLEAGAQD